jgi:SAM-dependent methyltransferase
MNNLKFNIKDVPVFWRETKKIIKSSKIPSVYPMSLLFDPKKNFIKQAYSKKTNLFLNKIYNANENIGYLQDDNPLNKIYGPEFVSFIEEQSKLPKKKILEIGCGGMYTLNELKKKGACVEGCDPSPVAKFASHNYNIKLTKDFYPSKKIKKKYDIILHYDVLEHVWDPKKFIKSCLKNLNETGKVIFVIPDCTEQVLTGDISLFIHQHVNFFTEKSITCFLNELGFSKILVRRSKITGVLMCCISNFCKNKSFMKNPKYKKLVKDESINFFTKVKNNYIKIEKQIGENLRSLSFAEKIGFYPPLRAMPYLSKYISCKKNINKISFIDDNQKVSGKYICDIPIKIFPLNYYKNEAIKIIYVTSKAFKKSLIKKIKIKNKKIKICELS